MTDGFATGFAVDSAQVRAHAAALDGLRDRFGAITAAGAAISQDSAAYGLLCGWMSAILEQRHRAHDELYAYLEENLQLASDSLRAAAEQYDEVDATAADRLRKAAGQ